MWRLNACERLMLPPERVLKRLAALRLVFILGMTLLLHLHMATGGPCGALCKPRHHFLFPATASYVEATGLGSFGSFGSFFTSFLTGFFTSFLLFFGASTITSCRPSILGYCSTTACGSRSCLTRSISRTPNSWCAISRPR